MVVKGGGGETVVICGGGGGGDAHTNEPEIPNLNGVVPSPRGQNITLPFMRVPRHGKHAAVVPRGRGFRGLLGLCSPS